MKRFLPLLFTSLALSVGQVYAQYTINDACTTPFEDISGTGTALGLGDDGETNVTLPFDFTLYDITSTDVRIGNNGGVIFNATTGDLFAGNDPLPTGDWTSGILAFWDDLDNETGDVYIETRGTAPFRRFIVQWHMRPHFNNIGDATLQAILYESTNQIRFVYEDIDFGDPAFNHGVSATIGLQKDGATFDEYSFNTSIAGVSCILFSPPPTANCQDLTVQLDATGNYAFDVASSTPQTDAEQLAAAGNYTGTTMWQSFTPTVSGVLHSVTFNLPVVYTGAGFFLEIFDGEGDGGTLLFSVPRGVTNPTGDYEWVLESTLDVVAGNTYTFSIEEPILPTAITFAKNDLDPYPGGRNNTSAGSDFVFSTKILQRPDIDNGTTAAVGLAMFDVSHASFDCADAASTVSVGMLATDNNGNTTSCVANVTIQDTEVPVASCVPDAPTPVSNTYSDSPGSAIGPNTSTTTSTITVPDNFDVTDLTVDIDITHTWSGDLEINLEHNGTVVNLINGECDSDDDLVATFDDAGTAITCPLTGVYAPIDALAGFAGDDASGDWTLTVNDNATGDGGTLNSWTLNINGVVPPTLIELALDATGNYTVDPLNDIDNGSSDNCGVTLTASPASFTCSDFGSQSVTLTATDPTGNFSTCTTTVEVIDNIDPDAQCQNHTLVLDGSGAATLTTADINNGSSDNCGINTIGLDQTAFNCSDIGANTVTLTVTDLFGNSSDCSATVTVEDNEFPVINCPSDITVCADDASGAVVTYATVTGSDNCTFNITQTDASGLGSGDNFPLGVTNQEWTIVDAASNTTTCTFDITVNASPVADYVYSPACQGEATFFTDQSTIDASTSIASWEWDMGDGSATIGLVDPIHAFADTGMYDVDLVVTSVEGCTDTTTQTVQVGSVPSASFTVANGCEGNPTTFTNTSTIDAGTLSYSWNFGDSNTSTDENPAHTYAIDGTYTVTLTVTSDNGCEDTFTGSVEVFDSPTALFSASTECEGFATDFTNLSTGAGPLTYSWDFGDSNSSTDQNPTHTYAAAGDYTVVLTVTNGNSCVGTSTVVVTVNPLPSVDFTFNEVCEGIPTDLVNASDAGSYAWDFGDSNSSTLEDVSHTYATFGLYDVTLTVTDANFCINSATQQVEVFDLPDFTLTPSEVLCYGEATGSIVTNPVGTPTFPWDFSVNGGTPQINDTFLNLPAGNYDVTVEDDNGCEFTVSTTITQPSDTLGIDVSALVDILCNGESTGEISIMGTGGTSPYTYAVNAGSPQTNGSFSGLPAGTHDVQIVDANLCVFDTTITLTEPDTLVLGLTNSENLLCNGDFTGEISVAGTGGIAPYEYNLDGGAYTSDSTFTGLAAGDYIVGVLDANGCTDTVQVTLTEPGILMLSLVSVNDANCFGESNGSIEVGASSGTPGYQYSLDGVNFQGSGVFEGLAAGTYTVTVMDANGCTAQLTETIFEPSLLTIETNSTPVACFGEITGEIVIIADGGTSGYSYSIDEGVNYETNGGIFSDLTSGEYIAVVQDANGCTASEGVVISEPTAALDLDVIVQDALCLDSASGVVTVIGTGGTPTYTYSIDNSTFGSDNVFEGFAAGNYTLYAQDVNGCADSVTFNVGEPATSVEITSILLNNPACPNDASGTATVTATGGTPGYMYSSNAGNTYQMSSILQNLNGGNHLIVVQDANGCEITDTITLASPELLSLEIDTIIGVACENDLNGEIHVIASGGTPSYNYTLNGGNLQSNGDYVNLTDGTYTVQITDVNGCTFSDDFVVTAEQLQPVADFTWTSSGTAVLFTNTSGSGDSYLWEFGDDSTSTEENPVHVYEEDGSYQVTLTVTNDCGESTITRTVNTIFTSIDDEEEVNFSIFPNPTSFELNLQASKTIRGNVQLEIVSTTGQLIRTQQIGGLTSNEITQVDINGLASGIYYLRLLSNKQQTVLRFDIVK